MNHAQYRKLPFNNESIQIPHAQLAKHRSNDCLNDHAYLMQLCKLVRINIAQKEAITHFTGPLLTLAGAGSGKTTVLVCRAGYLINVHQVHPRNILLMTFTKKAAEEMKERLATLPHMTNTQAKMVQTSTFHAFCLIILRNQGFSQKILSNDRFKQIIVKKLLKEAGIEDLYEPETLLSLFSSWKMNMNAPNEDESIRKTVSKEVLTIYEKYEKWKEVNHQIDFDDILYFSYKLLIESPALLESLQKRFQYIMVDEFQDTNLLQYSIIKLLASQHRNLMVVGDDDQTIYSFNGAKNELILNFHKEFPDVKEVVLDINYRSHSSIVGLGNEIIRHNRYRKKKTLSVSKAEGLVPHYSRPYTVDKEAEVVVEHIQSLVQESRYSYNDIAILYRASSNSRAIFERLIMEKLPFIHYSQGDLLFYEQWVVKPVIDYLRVAINPNNLTAVEGIMPTLYISREVGMGYISINQELQPRDQPLEHLKELPTLKEFQRRSLNERIQFIKSINRLTPIDAVNKIRRNFYDKYVQGTEGTSITMEKETIKEMLDELETSAKRFQTIAEFLNFIDEMKNKQKEAYAGEGSNENRIQLMTIHKAKGLEFPVVYLIGASESILPHKTAMDAEKIEKVTREEKVKIVQDALEEERRLTYVAVTRAMEEIYISSPVFYRGKEVNISRFFTEAFRIENDDKEKKQQDKKPKRKITVLAWICTNHECQKWKRVTSFEEAEQKDQKCPICAEKMEQGEKVVHEI